MKPCLIHFAASRTPVDVSVLRHTALKNASVTVKGALACLGLSDKYCSHNANTSSFLLQLFETKFQSKNHSRRKRKPNVRTLVNGNRKIKRRVKQRKPVASKLQFRIIIFFSLENLRGRKKFGTLLRLLKRKYN